MTMTRTEHLQWCKDRALVYADAGDDGQALASMCSDLGKHPELENHIGIQLGMMIAMQGGSIREWIIGFN